MKRRLLSFFICFALATVSLFVANNANVVKASEAIISADEAVILAIAHVNSDRLSSGESFEDNIHISKVDSLINLDGNNSAYLIEFDDSDKNAAGYIIVGASREQIPIIEYAYDGRCFLDRAKQVIMENEDLEETDLNIYYMGGYDYYIGKNKDSFIYKISSNGIEKVKRSEVNSSDYCEFNKTGKDEVNLMWINLENNIKENNIKNNNKDNIILPEGKFKSAYKTPKSLTVKDNTNISYSTIYEYKGNLSQRSGPLCGVNLLKYWYRQGIDYYKLQQKSWDNVFEILYDDFNLVNNTITYPEDYLDTLKKYFKEYAGGCSSSAYYSFNVSWGKITDEIDSNYPVTLIFKGNDIFSSQYVLGVGYKEYTNDTNNYRYILIADGLGSKATRYVNYYTEYKTGTGIAAFRLRPF